MTDYPTYGDLLCALGRGGCTLEAFEACGIQGVLIRWNRPAREGEALFGMPVADLMTREVIERHYTPDVEASPDVRRVTEGRAIQRAIWDIDAEAGEAHE